MELKRILKTNIELINEHTNDTIFSNLTDINIIITQNVSRCTHTLAMHKRMLKVTSSNNYFDIAKDFFDKYLTLTKRNNRLIRDTQLSGYVNTMRTTNICNYELNKWYALTCQPSAFGATIDINFEIKFSYDGRYVVSLDNNNRLLEDSLDNFILGVSDSLLRVERLIHSRFVSAGIKN